MIRRSQFLEYVDRFQSCRVVVVGPSVLEVDVPCDMPHLAADRPMPAITYTDHSDHPGSAALTAATVAALGGRAALITPLGVGAIGRRLAAVPDLSAVEIINTIESDTCPQLARFLTAQDRQLLQLRCDWHALADGLEVSEDTHAQLNRMLSQGTSGGTFGGCSVCIVDGQPRLNMLRMVSQCVEAAHGSGIPTVYDAARGKEQSADIVREVPFDHLICNEAECRALGASRPGSGGDGSADDLGTIARSLAGSRARHIILTRGRHGVEVITDDGDARIIETTKRSLAERRGVGFVFSGVYSLALAAGATAAEAAFLAGEASSIAVSRPGPKSLTREDLLHVAYREIEGHVRDAIELFEGIGTGVLGAIDSAARMILEAYARGRQVLVFGNGGSAAEANHLVTELTGHFRANRPSLPAISLSSNDALITAVANDYSFDDVFSHQIGAFCRPGDVVIGLTTSGNSENVRRALREARKHEARTIVLTGNRAVAIHELADLVIAVPSSYTPRIQEAHLFVIHVLCDMLESRLDAQGRVHPGATEI